MKPFELPSSMVSVLVLLASCARTGPGQGSLTSAVAQIAATDTCSGPQLSVGYAPDSLSPNAQCALINAALHELAKTAPTEPAVATHDSQGITKAAIYQWNVVDAAGRRLDPYITVEFCLDRRPYNLVVYLRSDGSMRGVRSHRGPRECTAPFGPPT